MPVYATADQLAGFVPEAVTVPDEPEASRLLAHASEVVDGLLLTAVYDVGDDGAPTDEQVAAALRAAACAQALWWLETGDESGAQAQYQSVSIGSVSLTRGYTSGASATGPAQTISPRAVSILQQASLIMAGPIGF
jgi:hypothetical protein